MPRTALIVLGLLAVGVVVVLGVLLDAPRAAPHVQEATLPEVQACLDSHGFSTRRTAENTLALQRGGDYPATTMTFFPSFAEARRHLPAVSGEVREPRSGFVGLGNNTILRVGRGAISPAARETVQDCLLPRE